MPHSGHFACFWLLVDRLTSSLKTIGLLHMPWPPVIHGPALHPLRFVSKMRNVRGCTCIAENNVYLVGGLRKI
jgi:hypothetical protein